MFKSKPLYSEAKIVKLERLSYVFLKVSIVGTKNMNNQFVVI